MQHLQLTCNAKMTQIRGNGAYNPGQPAEGLSTKKQTKISFLCMILKSQLKLNFQRNCSELKGHNEGCVRLHGCGHQFKLTLKQLLIRTFSFLSVWLSEANRHSVSEKSLHKEKNALTYHGA